MPATCRYIGKASVAGRARSLARYKGVTALVTGTACQILAFRAPRSSPKRQWVTASKHCPANLRGQWLNRSMGPAKRSRSEESSESSEDTEGSQISDSSYSSGPARGVRAKRRSSNKTDAGRKRQNQGKAKQAAGRWQKKINQRKRRRPAAASEFGEAR